MVKTMKFDGKIPQWHHVECFFEKVEIPDLDCMNGLKSLRFISLLSSPIFSPLFPSRPFLSNCFCIIGGKISNRWQIDLWWLAGPWKPPPPPLLQVQSPKRRWTQQIIQPQQLRPPLQPPHLLLLLLLRVPSPRRNPLLLRPLRVLIQREREMYAKPILFFSCFSFFSFFSFLLCSLFLFILYHTKCDAYYI